MCKSVCEAQHVQVCLHIVLSVSLTSLQGLLRLPEAEGQLWEKNTGPIKCVGHHSKYPNICDLLVEQTKTTF